MGIQIEIQMSDGTKRVFKDDEIHLTSILDIVSQE